MSKGDEDIRNEEDTQELEENDEISDAEEGFAEGYEEDLARCAVCGKTITTEEPIELNIKGEHYMFCSTKHAEEFKKQHKK